MDQVGRPKSPTAVIAERIRDLRTQRRWSAQRLAEEMTKVGVEWNRGVVTKLENNRREAVSVAELLALALVFDVPPLAILLPREDGDIQITVDRAAPAGEVGEWFIGPHPLRAPVNSESVQHPGANFTRQQQYFADWPAYLRRPPTVPEGEQRAEDLNKQLAARQEELQRLLVEVDDQRHRLALADAEQARRRERRWAVERDLITLMERRRESEVQLREAHHTLQASRARLEAARQDAKKLEGSVDMRRHQEVVELHRVTETGVWETETRVRHLEQRHQELLTEMGELNIAMKALEQADADGS